MTTLYKILFTVNVSHSYYVSGCMDFEFVLNADSEQLLRNFRLIAKVRADKLFILYEANDTGTALLIAAGKTIRIGLKLLNPYFSNITDLPITVKKKPVIYLYRNTANPSALDIPKEIGNYSDPEIMQAGLSGIVEIRIHRSFYTSAPAFTISFNARKETLKYYIVARNYNANELNQLSVTDNGFTEDERLQITFSKLTSDAFATDDISPSLFAGSDTSVLLFKSQALIDRREKGRKKIQLHKNGDVLIRHLPQPGAERVNGDLIINISKQ